TVLPNSTTRSPASGKMAERDGEFDLIADLFAPLSGEGALNLTDDAAVLTPAPGKQLVIAKDAMVEGVHYLPDTAPGLIARKLMRTNLSDLAAMGAEPVGYLIAMFRDSSMNADWLKGFAAGLRQDQECFGLSLVGGDSVSTPGPGAFSLTILGQTEPGQAILRGGAQAGDLVYVTGTIGDAGLGLKILQNKLTVTDPAHRSFLISRHQVPEPRLAIGHALRGIASAAIDVSDGLISDIGHIADVSGLAGEIDISGLPVSTAAEATGRDLLTLATSGDDYELVFCSPADRATDIDRLAAVHNLRITCIGRMTAGSGIQVFDENGSKIDCDNTGWRHY
ncbi:MAG: thiamine-phosphate kinase, partial [Rhodospirillales bacterium]